MVTQELRVGQLRRRGEEAQREDGPAEGAGGTRTHESHHHQHASGGAQMKKPLERCCNGCDAPPQPPSWVLCKACLDALDAKMRALCTPAAGRGK